MRERHIHSTCGKSRKRLSELMNSVQQFHPTRSRLDSSLLWNIIGELESFHNKDPIRRIQLLDSRQCQRGSGDLVNFKCFPSKKTQAQEKRPHNNTKKIEILKKGQLNVTQPPLSNKEHVIDTVVTSSNSQQTSLENGSRHDKEKEEIKKVCLISNIKKQSQPNVKTIRKGKQCSVYQGKDPSNFESIVNNNNISNNDSRVKSLTNYWNTYLNKDMKKIEDRTPNDSDKVNGKTKILPVPELCKSLSFNDEFEYFNGRLPTSKPMPLKVFNIKLNNHSPLDKHVKKYSFYNTEFKSSSCCIKDESKYFGNRNSSVEPELVTDDAIEVMQRIIYTLSNFPETSILSYEVPLPPSVKAILCLLTTAMIKQRSQDKNKVYEVDLRKLCEDDVENKKQNVCTTSTNEVIAIGYQPQVYKTRKSKKNYLVPLYKNTTPNTQSNSVLVFHGISLHDVNIAIRYFDLLKEIFFMRFASLSDTSTEYTIENEQFEETFTLIYERHIFFDETFVIDNDILDLKDEQNNMHYLLEETLAIPKRIVKDVCCMIMKEVENILTTSINDAIKILCQISTACFFVWMAIIFLSLY